MEPAKHITDNPDIKILGLDTFSTFLKICEAFSEFLLDDMDLANRSDSYKVWVCWIRPEKIAEIRSVIERYKSMADLLHYYDNHIVEKGHTGLYVKLDWEQNAWNITYGITNNKKLFMIGKFPYDFNTTLPDVKICKYIKDEIEDFDSRKHILLYSIKKDMVTFNPGYCKRIGPQLIDSEVTLTCFDLGIWTNGELSLGEADKFLAAFKEWVKTQKWWSAVHLIVRPRLNKAVDFIVKIK